MGRGETAVHVRRVKPQVARNADNGRALHELGPNVRHDERIAPARES
jgi:hypothetical protein